MAAALAPGLGTNFADYAYRTIYTPTTGTPVTQYTEAVLGKPTPINVTGSGGTQFTGTISPSTAIAPAGVTLKIQRASTMPAGDKVRIEAVLLDPASSDTYFGFGEDGSAAGTAATWSATVSLLSVASSSVEFGLSPVKATTPPTSLAVLGELFSGTDPDHPTSDAKGNVSFAPVPATLSVDLTLTPSSVEASLTNGSSSPSLVNANVTSVSPTDTERFHATINAVAASTHLVYDTTGPQTLTYTASAAAKQLAVTYQHHVLTTLAAAASIIAVGVPKGVTFTQQSGAPQLAVTTTGGAISAVEARYGEGTNIPASPSGTGAYLAFAKTTKTATMGARLSNLEQLTLDAGQPYSVNLQMSAPLAAVALVVDRCDERSHLERRDHVAARAHVGGRRPDHEPERSGRDAQRVRHRVREVPARRHQVAGVLRAGHEGRRDRDRDSRQGHVRVREVLGEPDRELEQHDR